MKQRHDPLADLDPVILELAQAINGPYDETVVGWESLFELRKARWANTKSSDKHLAVWQARAVLKTQQHRAVACQVPVTRGEAIL